MTGMPLDGIPTFPEYRHIGLEDRPQFEGLFSRYPTEVSERTFASLYVWRAYDRSYLSQLDGHLLLFWHRERFGRCILEPVGPDPASVIDVLMSEEKRPLLPFSGVFGMVDPLISGMRKRGLSPEPLRDEWDYVYRTEDLVKLEGPEYHTKRKEMKKATSEYDLIYEPMTRERLKDCLALEESWCDMKHCTLDRFTAAEDRAMKEALLNFYDLGMIGAAILLGGKVQAMTVGERLNSSTAVVHFEKANPAVRGLYQVINQQFCEHALKDFEFVNREQDVGDAGLRRAKEGYHPHHFVEKHWLPLRRDQ